MNKSSAQRSDIREELERKLLIVEEENREMYESLLEIAKSLFSQKTLQKLSSFNYLELESLIIHSISDMKQNYADEIEQYKFEIRSLQERLSQELIKIKKQAFSFSAQKKQLQKEIQQITSEIDAISCFSFEKYN